MTSGTLPASLDTHNFPQLSTADLAALGPIVVVAPHPDDESLGCGGLLALLRHQGTPVECVLVSDGTMSHPGSTKFAAAARQQLREKELREALAVLGLGPDSLHTLRLPDGAVPGPEDGAGPAAVAALAQLLEQAQAATVLVPWRRDPHPDHRATSRLVAAALARLPRPPRRLEYVVWAWERAAPDDLPQPGEVRGWQVDIAAVLDQKQQAIAAHRSQLPGGPIDDDPAGFTLAPAMLSHFARPVEVFLEG